MPDLNGPSPTLPNTSSYQIGDGNSNEMKMEVQGAPTLKTADVTLTTAELLTGIISYTGAGHTLTLPTAAALDSAFPNAKVNSAFDFSVIATTGTATVAVGAGITAVGALTVAASTATRFRLRKTATGAWTIYRFA